jgi:hypothetical protein
MTIRRTIYQQLAADPILVGYLAKSTVDPALPAIYNFWAPADTPDPYINYSISDAPDGVDTYQRNATVVIDIFLKDGDREKADMIKRRVKRLLLGKPLPEDPEDGPIRAFPGPGGAGEVREDDPAVVHINETVELIYYDLEVIRAINE